MQVLAIVPNHEGALFNLAKARYFLKQYTQAIEQFNYLVSMHPGNAMYISERAVALHLQGDNDEALADFDKAVALDPENPYRYSSRAFFKDRTKDYHGAIADYERAIELDPEDAIAFNNKGLVEEKLGYMERAKKSFSRADNLDGYKGNTQHTASTAPPTKNTATPTPTERPQTQQQKLSGKAYMHTLKEVLLTKQGFRNFIQHYTNKLSGK